MRRVSSDIKGMIDSNEVEVALWGGGKRGSKNSKVP